jgi:large subunit ribosomal protein L23
MRDFQDTLKNIWLTEKATALGALNKYVFRVDVKATKPQIRKAVEAMFGKKVLDVNTCNYAGKKKRERRADYGRRPHWKKAIVTLKEGEKIDVV